MKYYENYWWGIRIAFEYRASVFPQAFSLALPSACVALGLASVREHFILEEVEQDVAQRALAILVGFTAILTYILSFRCSIAHDRYWEAGTLLQQCRGEWFNAYSSIVAFSSTDPLKALEIEKFHHQLARLMSLLYCQALQQVSADKERPLEIIDPEGFDRESMYFLQESSDSVEVIRQWVQRLMVLNMESGLIPVAPPILSRAFQELSRGVVHLQNARKIADFPFPFPYAQFSALLLIVHWIVCGLATGALFNKPLAFAVAFVLVFSVWCVHHLALQLERPYGEGANHLPMTQMQREWNQSLGTLLLRRAQHPPDFEFRPAQHRQLQTLSSDGSRRAKSTILLPSPDLRSGETLGLPAAAVRRASRKSKFLRRSFSLLSGASSQACVSSNATDTMCFQGSMESHPSEPRGKSNSGGGQPVANRHSGARSSQRSGSVFSIISPFTQPSGPSRSEPRSEARSDVRSEAMKTNYSEPDSLDEEAQPPETWSARQRAGASRRLSSWFPSLPLITPRNPLPPAAPRAPSAPSDSLAPLPPSAPSVSGAVGTVAAMTSGSYTTMDHCVSGASTSVVQGPWDLGPVLVRTTSPSGTSASVGTEARAASIRALRTPRSPRSRSLSPHPVEGTAAELLQVPSAFAGGQAEVLEARPVVKVV